MEGIRPPGPFLATAATASIPWSAWYADFELYATAIGWSQWDPARQQALLLHCLGQEGRRRYRVAAEAATAAQHRVTACPPATTEVSGTSEPGASGTETAPQVKRESQGNVMSDCLSLLQQLFEKPRDVMSERIKFRRCRQKPGETVTVFLTNLREQSRHCAFGALEDEMIRDQFVEGCVSSRLRDRLCVEDQLTLQRLESIALAEDRAVDRQRLFGEGGGASRRDHPASPVSPPVEVALATRKTSSAPVGQHTKGKSCYACGRLGHVSTDDDCPAKGKKCRKCGAVGHFAVRCRSKVKPVRSVDENDAVHILAVTQNDCALKMKVKIAGCWMNMLVDTGAAVSIVPRQVYEQQLTHVPLQPTTSRLQAFGGSRLAVAGVIAVTVETEDGRSCQSSLYVTDGSTALLGRDLQRSLHISVKDGSVVCAVADAAPRSVDETTNVLPPIRGFVHRVQLRDDAVPVQQKLRPLPFAIREEVKRHLQELEEQQIIERVDGSPWISPIVVSRRRSGQIRLCVDLRVVNEAVSTSGYPLPDMQEMLDQLVGATVFSTLDMKAAYHQLMLHEDSRNLTAFVTHEGVFRYRRCCYGMRSLPSCFQKLMETILRGLPGTQVYLDDVIVAGRTREEHDARLKTVMEKLEEYQVTLNADKCHFGVERIGFLGFSVSKDGIEINPSRVQGLQELKAPSTVKDLQAMLGLLGFYSRFVPGYSSRVEELRRPLRKGAPPFKWTAEMQSAFEDVKEAILTSSALAMFDPSLPTTVTTDASDVGIGAVLTQTHPEGERVVAFASSTLSQAQRQYSVTEREALACVWSVEKWHKYLWGREFVLRTDHQALKTLMTSRGVGRAGMRISRWACRLMEYSFSVQHVKGSINPADGLSRLPAPVEVVSEDEQLVVAALSEETAAVSADELKAESRADHVLGKLRDQIPRAWPRRFSQCVPELQPFFRCRDELAVVDDIILRGGRVLVPTALRTRLVELAHEGHQGMVRTKQRLRDLYWWPGMDRAVEEQSSGLVERANKSIKAALQTADLQKADRAECLQAFLFAYRSTVQATTGRTPAELLHGRPMRGKLSAAVDVGGRLPERPGELHSRVEKKQAYQKRYFDKTHRVKKPDFEIGDRVRHRLPPQSRKGRPRFSRVKKVLERRGPASYVLDDGTRVHADRLTSGGGAVTDSRDEQPQQRIDSQPEQQAAGETAADGRQTERGHAETNSELPQPEQPAAPDADQPLSPTLRTRYGREVRRPVRYGFDE
ncbi:uncharacterized protein LOC122390579 [Amphibalanus amphitrite]|uniref:uncharacterized protein LOC122390579 n=1 Tax=Amphibalanus amphitrite TaxID=1232801 RepID=UPI001C918DCA|nr:uncharacterized protein LOC122390579 [Amphibalanus amphitrite]